MLTGRIRLRHDLPAPFTHIPLWDERSIPSSGSDSNQIVPCFFAVKWKDGVVFGSAKRHLHRARSNRATEATAEDGSHPAERQ